MKASIEKRIRSANRKAAAKLLYVAGFSLTSHASLEDARDNVMALVNAGVISEAEVIDSLPCRDPS